MAWAEALFLLALIGPGVALVGLAVFGYYPPHRWRDLFKPSKWRRF